MENNKISKEKKYKFSLSNKSLYLSIFELIKQDKRPSEISKILKLGPQHLQYYTTLLKKNGLIERVGYGVWAVKRSINFHYGSDSKRSIKKVRGHAFIWRVKTEKKFNWLDILKGTNYILIKGITPRVIINNKKIWLLKDRILIYENKSFYGINALESRKFAVYELIETLKKLETQFSISLGRYYFKPIKEHFGLIKNELARQCNDKGEKIKISDELDGDWLWIDDSESLAELETGGRGITKDRAALNIEVQNWYNDNKRTNFKVTPTFILNGFDTLTSNLNYHAENLRAHVEAVKDLGAGVNKFTGEIQNFLNSKTLDKSINRGTMDAKKNYEGGYIFIKLKNGREYSGKVTEVNADWLSLVDKFNKKVTISLDQVSVIEEQREPN